MGMEGHARKQRLSLQQTVPLARTMAEKITAQRNWATGRARNASTPPPNVPQASRRSWDECRRSAFSCDFVGGLLHQMNDPSPARAGRYGGVNYFSGDDNAPRAPTP